MPHAHHHGFGSLSISAALFLTALGYLYLRARVRALDPGAIAAWRAFGFVAGLSLIWVAIGSPLAGLDHQLLTAHMVQHLLLMTLAPPLIWLGAPLSQLSLERPRPLLQAIRKPFFDWIRLRRVWQMGGHPAVCWFAATAALVGWHIPAAFQLGARSGAWHAVEQASFLATGLLFWWPVVGSRPNTLKWPEWSVLIYLFLATLPCDILSGFLVFCDRVVYPVYSASPRPSGFSALEDQQFAGALMWTCVTVVYLAAGALVTARLLLPGSQGERAACQFQRNAAPHGGTRSAGLF